MENIVEFYNSTRVILESFERFLKENELIGRVKVDHIGYKCESNESFVAMRSIFESPKENDSGASRINQLYISKRRIALITLNRLIDTSVGKIGLLEYSLKSGC